MSISYHRRKPIWYVPISIVFLFLFTSELASALHYGHLRDEEVNYSLAELGSSKEAVLDAYFKKWDIPSATAEILLKVCLAPESPESKSWAEKVLEEEDTRYYAEVGTAYPILGKRHDSLIFLQHHHKTRVIDPQYSYFSGNLGVILDATYPRVKIAEPEYSLIKGGFQGDLSKEEEEALQSLAYSNLAAQMTASATSFRELFPYAPYDSYAYIHYTGDRFFLEQLLQSSLISHQLRAIAIAIMAKDSSLVRKVIKWLDKTEWVPEEFPFEEGSGMVIGYAKRIFMAHKDLPEVGELIRKWAKEPDAQFFQRDQLFMIMSEPGWSKDEDMFNKGVLYGFYSKYQRFVDSAEIGLEAIGKREESEQKK